jgi:xylulokinase
LDYFISLDIGTTSVKVALVGSDGSVPAIATREYGLETPSENIVELDARVYWDSGVEGIREVLRKSAVDVRAVRSVGVCSQGETLICLGADGEPLRKAIVWMDNRSGAEATELKERFWTGNNTGQTDMAATWPITKMLWLSRNEPRVFKATKKFMLPEDYILYKLSGQYVGEYSLYTSSCMLDIVKKQWWREILDYVEVEPQRLVRLCESGEIVGEVQSVVCEVTTLVCGTKVVTGAMDQTATMIGAGNIRNGIVTETTGAALAVCGTIAEFPKLRSEAMAVQYHAIPDEYFIIGWCPTGGMALKWLRDAFFAPEQEQAAQDGKDAYDVMTEMAAAIKPGCEGLTFLPYLAGPGTIRVAEDARGVFYGLEMHHGRGHFVRAVMESIGFVLREMIEQMESMGLECSEIRSLGGGSKSRFWNQIKADVLGRPVTTMKCPEASALGTAILQAVAVGTFQDYEQAVSEIVATDSLVEPVEANSPAYEAGFERFKNVNHTCFGWCKE